MQILENKSIALRALEPTDLKILYSWENNSDIWNISNTIVPFSTFVLKQYLETVHLDIFETKQLRLVIENKKTKEAIGLIDLFDFDPFNQKVGIGILINNKLERNKGYANEALETLCNYCFETLLLHQVYCNIETDNIASIKLFEKNNFKTIGIKKDWLRTKDGWKDELSLQRITKVKF